MIVRRLGLLLLCAIALGNTAAAKEVDDLTAPPPDVAGKTWFDLLRQVFPDIAPAAAGKRGAVAKSMIDLRSIGAGDESWIRCDDGIHIESIDAVPIRVANQDRLVVSLSVEYDCVGLLALFAADGKLIEAVNVKGDQHISFSGNYVRPLGPDGALVIASNWHDNSSQSYDISSLLLVKSDGFAPIGDVFAFGSRDCEAGFTEDAKITTTADATGLARIDAIVTRSAQKYAEDCEQKIGKSAVTTFHGFWQWNAAKDAYEPHTKQLDALDAENQKRL